MATEAQLLAAIKALTEKIGNMDKSKTSKEPGQDASPQEREEYSAQRRKEIEIELEYQKALKRTADMTGNVVESRKAEFEILKNMLETNEKLKEENVTLNDLKSMELDAYSDIQGELRKQILRYQELYQTTEGINRNYRDQQYLLDNIANSIGLNMRFEDEFLGSVINVSNALLEQGEAGDQAMRSFTDTFNSIFNLQNLALSIFSKIAEATIKLVKEFDSARASLAAATGTGYEFQDALFQAQREANLLGVTMADAAGATGTLIENTKNFVNISEKAKAQLIVTTASLQKLGVDGNTAAETFQFLNLNLGMTVEQAQRTQKELAMMGTELGISPAKITKDFNSALPTLAVYGDKAVDVFTNLASAAKAAGVETGALLSIAKQFDTFSGAAEGVAKMNALLGTQMSTTEMLMMTEDERIKTLIEQVQMQGIAFGDMDKYTQMAIANAAGIQDINEAQKIFGMNLADYEANKKIMDANADAQKKFEEAVQKTVPVMTQFMNLFTEIVTAAQPLLEFLGTVAEKLTKFLSETSTETKELFFGITALVTGLPLLIGTVLTAGKAFMAWITWLRGTKSAAKDLSDVGVELSEGLGESMENLSESGSKSFSSLGKGIKDFAVKTGKAVFTMAKKIGMGIASAVKSIGKGIASAITSISTAIAASAGIGAVVLAAIVAGAYAFGKMADAFASIQKSKAEMAKSDVELAKVNAGLAKDSGKVLENLSKIATSDFSVAIAGMRQLVQAANEFSDVDITARSTIENMALITVGKAKDSMTGRVITSGKNNIVANVQNVFKDMKMVVKIGENEFEGYVTDIAERAADQ